MAPAPAPALVLRDGDEEELRRLVRPSSVRAGLGQRAKNAVVLCVDEKSQIQALDRTAPVLPMQPHLIERRSPDYVRTPAFLRLHHPPETATAMPDPA